MSKPEESTIESVDHESMTGPQMKKRFNFWTAFGIAICTSGAWEGWTASIAQGLTGGGSVAVLWGWVFTSIGITCLACALGEFVSMWPSAGGQYVWASNLAPKSWARFMSWSTAWFSVAGLWLGALSVGIGAAVQIQSYVFLAREYDPKTWHAFLICIACMILWILVNVFAVRSLHYINQVILVLHVIMYFINIGVLAGTTKEKHDAKFVFADFENKTGWDNNFVSWSIGLLSALYAFFSLDGATHYCEEMDDADIYVPRAMLLQATISAVSTWPFIITLLFCIGNVAEVLGSTIGLMSPYTQILYNSTGNVGAAIFLNGFSTTVAMTAGFDLWGAASRAIWSMARDRALPEIFAKLHPRWGVPIWANLVLIPPSIAVFMIYIWNTTAFYGIMAGVLVAVQLSYFIPVGLYVLYARWRKDLVKGRFNMGRYSDFCHIVGFLFSGFMVVMMSFPVYQPVTSANMNYASVIIGAIFLLSIVMWFCYGRKRYTGPLDFPVGERAHREEDSKAEKNV